MKDLIKIIDLIPDWETITKETLMTAVCDFYSICHSCKKRKIAKEIRGDGWYPQFCNKCSKNLYSQN